MADNWFADQLIRSVGLGTRAVSRKTPIYFILGVRILGYILRKLSSLHLNDDQDSDNKKDNFNQMCHFIENNPITIGCKM